MKNLIFIAALLSVTFAAQAEEGNYAGLGLGYATQKLDIPSDLRGIKDESKGKFGGKVYAGYQFNDNFALEAGYNYLNKDKINYSDTESGETDKGSLSIQGHIFSLTANGILPLGESFSLVGKLGAAIYHSKAEASERISDSSSSIGFNKSAKKTAAAPVFGVGAEFKLDKTLTLRTEYENFGKPKVGNKNNKMKRVDMFSVGLRSTFN